LAIKINVLTFKKILFKNISLIYIKISHYFKYAFRYTTIFEINKNKYIYTSAKTSSLIVTITWIY